MKCCQEVTQLSQISWRFTFRKVNKDLLIEVMKHRPGGWYSALFYTSKILCGVGQEI